jgi:hypothetical protein
VSGYKRLPRQDVIMKPVKSVLVKRRNSEGEGEWGSVSPERENVTDAVSGLLLGVVCQRMTPRDIYVAIPRP